MTYLELRTAALEALIDMPTIVQNAVPRLVNQAIKRIEQRFNFKIMEANQLYLTTKFSRTLTPSVLPTDFKEFRGKPVYAELLGGSRELGLSPHRDAVLRRWSFDDIGDPHQLVTDAGVLEVWPQPDGVSDYADGEYRITMPYWKYLANLVADGDTNWFTLNADQYIINWVVAEGFAVDWDEKRSDYWTTRMEKEAHSVILTGKKQYYSQDDTLIPHQGALEPQTQR